MPLRAFTANMNAAYLPHAGFMSRQVFAEWIFSWLANFQKDFRKQCAECGPNPKVLACDGTKIGISLCHASVRPIEEPTSTSTITPNHQRTARQYFSYSIKDNDSIKMKMRCAQSDLSYFVAKNSSTLTDWLKSAKREHIERTDVQRKEHIIECTSHEFKEITSCYLNVTFEQNLISRLNPIMLVLASSSPITSLINYRFFQTILELATNPQAMYSIRYELPEIFNLLEESKCSDKYNIVSSFIIALVLRSKEKHADDPEPPAPNILEPYDPLRQGKAYYFTNHGGRIRDLPTYNIAKTKDNNSCKKYFTGSSKAGTTFLFLWFCPLHGHCYGFHMITGSEGRKDPASSAFQYLQNPPDELYYDFSCQLEEYCLNREPGYWRCCRFHHDVFHGFSHKCPFVYNSSRLLNLSVRVNSSICEQFNSYIQKIKYSARAMSQHHFVFYLQFFIDDWNDRKTITGDSRKSAATAFTV